MSDTPRTDAAIQRSCIDDLKCEWVEVGFARQLEHDLNVANNWIEHHQDHVDDLIKENAALRAELKRQRALWQATYALGLAERDFAIKCIETALGPNKAQSWGDDQIMRQCLNEGGTPT
jgi:hypothetical protein